MPKFKLGDRVQLNSGGLILTVGNPEEIVHGVLTEDYKGVMCLWFENVRTGGHPSCILER